MPLASRATIVLALSAPALIATPASAQQGPAEDRAASRVVGPAPSAPSGAAEPLADRPVEVDKIRFQPGKGLAFRSEDGDFAMTLRLRAQWLYTLRRDAPGEALEHGLEIRRARVQFGGHVFGEHNKYKAEFALSPRDMGFEPGEGPARTPLLDWYAEFDHVRDATFRIGQYKVPFSRQRVISSGDLQMVDRSLAQSEFNLDRDVGAHVYSPDLGGLGLLRYYAGAWVNEGRDASELGPVEMMFIGRLEALPLGIFDDYAETDLKRHARPKLSVGFAYAHLDDAGRDRGILGSSPEDAGTTDFDVVTADFLFKWSGFSAIGEIYRRRGLRTPGDALDPAGAPAATAPPRNGFGWFLQAGYLLPSSPIELSARYSEVRPLGAASALEEEHEAGLGLSFYPGGHSLKVQGDYFRIWDAGGLDEGRDQLRAQLQLAY